MQRRRKLRAAGIVIAPMLAGLLAMPAGATNPGRAPQRSGGHTVGVVPLPPLRGPAGPTPLNPAGPTPLNPAGPTPLNPAGPSISFPRQGGFIQQPGVYVGVVGGGGNYRPQLGGSFYCQVHNRGYASQGLFFDHLAGADGLYGDEALSYLIDDGGVWIFPVE